MAVTSKLFGLVYLSAFNKEIDYDTDSIKAMLVTSAWTPNQDTHRYKSSVTNEAVGTGYTAGGKTLTGKTIAYNTGSNVTTLDCDDLVWTTTTVQARYLVFYVSTGSDSTSPLISYVDFGADVTSTGGSFTAAVPAAGFAQFTAT